MSIFPRRSSKLTRRIGRIEKELSSVDSRIRSLTKRVEEQGDSVLDRAGLDARKTSAPRGARAQMRTEIRPVAATPRPYQGSAIAGKVLRSPAGALVGPAPAAERSVLGGKSTPHGDEQFASYFMSGSLKKTDVPLRQERHVQRAKALFLLLFFVLLLFALVFFKVFR